MENSRAVISDAYKVLLGRKPWETEILYWREFFRAGGSLAGLYQELSQSHEGQLMRDRMEKRQKMPGRNGNVYEKRSA